LNRRQPIYWMIACGLVVIFVLTFIPHFIKARTNLEIAFALTPSTDVAEAKPKELKPSFDAASWYAARGETPETHGVLIESLDGKRALASLNPGVTFNPASLLKLATSLVALKKLGANYHFQTRVLSEGAADGKGTLYVQGSDPTFGDAGAALIGKELHARGIERLSEIVVSPEFCFNFSNSPEESASRLVKALKLGNPKTTIADESGGQLLTVVNSNPLSDVLLYMNARSSNFIAEKIGALIGGAGGVQQFLVEELKLPADQVTIETVSGREHNRLTPRDLLKVIRSLIEEAKRQGLEPADIMPVASDDAGTLRRRLAGTGLEGAVVAKTGTLTSEVDGGMASLAGIVYTQQDGIILFAIMDQGNRIWDNRQLEDQLLAEVVTTHATPQVIAGPTPRRLLPSTNVSLENEGSGVGGRGSGKEKN
jgi:D-alanyl-D-alanine carboxypeptidase/D-alanyl-D-alanine-endopeptidase (penicillin-binding protein 4)